MSKDTVGRLQAAIDKLEAEKVSHDPGPHIDLRDVSIENTKWFLWALPILKRDRRTLDAQLAILRGALVTRDPWDDEPLHAFVVLADAILGSDEDDRG
jgi:hypothetical protein